MIGASRAIGALVLLLALAPAVVGGVPARAETASVASAIGEGQAPVPVPVVPVVAPAASAAQQEGDRRLRSQSRVDVVGPGTEKGQAPSEPVPPAVAVPASAAPRVQLSFNPVQNVGNGTLTEDTVWKGEVLVDGVVVVAPQTTLTVAPGTTVRFRHGDKLPLLMVQGRLVVQGTHDQPVLFGSSYAEPGPGDWQGVLLLGSDKKNSIEHCRIEGAETALEVLFSTLTLRDVSAVKSGTGLKLQDALVNMDGGGTQECVTGFDLFNSEVSLSGVKGLANARGIQARSSSLFLSRGSFTGNASALTADSCRVKVQGGEFRENGAGIQLTGGEGTVSGATISRNGRFGLSLTNARMRVTGNDISQNRDAGIIVEDGAAVAWSNAISSNGGCDVANLGTEDFRAPGNWWGGGGPRLCQNNGRGRVAVAPVLAVKPRPGNDQ